LTEDSEVTFVKVPLEFGVTTPLDEELLREAVRAVRKVWRKHLRAPDATTPSILIYCRYMVHGETRNIRLHFGDDLDLTSRKLEFIKNG